MPPGWNLGNSFDATPNETSWGNPTPNQTLIKAVHAAGFNTLRIPVTWTNHIGAGPAYTIDAAWMAKVTQTAQWAVDEGMFVFVNTHHDADGQWITFPATASAAATVAAEVKAVWTQIATAFKSFDAHLMLECFNEPHNVNGNDAATQTDLNMYLEACVNAIRGTGGANATRLIMIQPVGASPLQDGIQSMMNASIIGDPNLLISIHTYHPTNFGLSETRYAWGSADDYTSMRNSHRTGDPGLVADPAHRHRRMGLHGGSGDDQQSRSRPGLLSGCDDGRHGSALVGQRRLRQRFVRALQQNHRRSNVSDDRQRNHDGGQEWQGGAQQLGDACQSITSLACAAGDPAARQPVQRHDAALLRLFLGRRSRLPRDPTSARDRGYCCP